MRLALVSNHNLFKSPVFATATIHAATNVARMAMSLVTIPILLSYLGEEGLGLWFVVLSFHGLFGFLSSGFNSAAITAVSRANGQNDELGVAQICSSMLVLSAIATLVFWAVGFFPATRIDWYNLLSVEGSISKQNVSDMMIVMLFSMSFSFLAHSTTSIVRGQNKGYVFYSLELTGIFFSGCALVVAVITKQEIQTIVACFLLPQQVIPFLGSLVWILRTLPNHLDIRLLSLSTTLGLVKNASALATNQAAISIANNSDLFLIGTILGAPASSIHGIAQRLFSIPYLVIGTPADALWPVFAGADADGRREWLLRAFFKLFITLLILATISAILIFVFFSEITLLWLRQETILDWWLIAGAAVFCVLQVILHVTSIFFRSLNMNWFLTKTTLAMAITNLPISIALLHLIGVSGAIWGTVLTNISCVLVPHLIKAATIARKCA